MKSGTSLARGGARSARTALSAQCERKLPSHALGGELRARLRLGITLYTVKDHVKAALVKTRSATRTELAARLRGA